MRFHVLGLGPIGSLLAHNLSRSIPRKPHITLIHKTAERAVAARYRGHKIRVETKGARIESTGYFDEVFQEQNAASTDNSTSTTPTDRKPIQPGDPSFIESLFVTTKAQSTFPAIQSLHHRLSPVSTIVLLQNGMGLYEELVTHVFPDPSLRPHFILATNTHGAYIRNDTVVHSGIGSIEFGIIPEEEGRNFEASASPKDFGNLSINDITKPGDPQYEKYKYLRSTVAALQLLEDLDVSWKPISYIQLAMRRKLVVNAVINPLTALLRCENGALLNENAHIIAEQICQEAANVFAAQIASEAKQYGDTEEHARLPPILMPTRLLQEVQRVLKLTKANTSSMLSDIEKGRDSEIDYINGYIMRVGEMLNVPTPTITALYHLIKMRSALPLDRWI